MTGNIDMIKRRFLPLAKSTGHELSRKFVFSTFSAPCALPSGSIWEPAGDSGKNALTISWLASSNPCARGQIKHYVVSFFNGLSPLVIN